MNDTYFHLLSHALVQHKVSLLRMKATTPDEFRRLIGEIALLLGCEATRDIALENRDIETPLAHTRASFLAEHICLVPILRAGLGMLDSLLKLIPSAAVGHIGLCRDEKTLQPLEYYCKLPQDINSGVVFLLDPMLATGGSAVAAISLLKKRGAKKIRILNILGAPEGVKAVHAAHPDVDIYLAQLDDGLNKNGYILPGVGDAGDRIFGTL